MANPFAQAQTLYEVLPADTIRCIRLTGTCLVGEDASKRDLAITCSLETVALSEVRQKKTSYRALSYVWGSPRFTRWIVCNGVQKAVTSNLYEALWHFTFGKEAMPLLWIDAICINQNDNTDKAQQVCLMADIYREAELVMIWLGTVPAANMLLERFWTNLDTLDLREAVKDKEAFDLGVSFVNSVDWFTRVWTLQEIVLAQDATVHCGFFSVSWFLFDKISGIVDEAYIAAAADDAADGSDSDSGSSEASFQEPEISMTASLFPAAEILSRLRRPFFMPEKTLYRLIQATWDRNATNLRDKVYALLGLCDDPTCLTPDYGQSVLQTYAHAVLTIWKEEAWLWMNMKNVRALATTGAIGFKSRQRILSVPADASPVSWIPDLRDRNVDDSEQLEDYPGDWRFQGPKRPEPSYTTLHPSFVPKFELSGANMVAQGVIVGAWRQLSGARKVGWQYGGQGVFEGFPSCVAKHSILNSGREPDIKFSAATDIYEATMSHIAKRCTCEEQEHSGKGGKEKLPSTKRRGKHDPEGEASGLGPTAWLCLLFGRAEPLVLLPTRDHAEGSKLLFKVVNRLPYQHPWAVQMLRAGTLQQPSSAAGLEELWHAEARWRMGAGDRRWPDESEPGARLWHDGLAELSGSSRHGEGDGGSSQLSLAFREGTEEERTELRKLAAKHKQMPFLEDCHLNWIPTTFEIVGELSE